MAPGVLGETEGKSKFHCESRDESDAGLGLENRLARSREPLSQEDSV